MNSTKHLIFVYNADSGFFNSLTDYVHKIVSPKTYSCNLCAITFDNRGMKEDWKKFIDSIDASIEFLHRDEFRKEYNMDEIVLPAVFKKDNDNLQLAINAEEINGCKTLEELKNLVTKKLNENQNE